MKGEKKKGKAFISERTPQEHKLGQLIKIHEGIDLKDQVRKALENYYKKKANEKQYKQYLGNG